MQALILYYSGTGRTALAMQFIKKGLESEDVVVTSMNLHKVQQADLQNKDIILFGTPVHFGGPSMPLRRFLNNLPEGSLAITKKVAVFMTYLFWGAEPALATVEEILEDKGATNILPGLARRAGFLHSLWNVITGSTEDEEAWINFGKLIATS